MIVKNCFRERSITEILGWFRTQNKGEADWRREERDGIGEIEKKYKFRKEEN